jgi:hypothetical protein
MEQPVQMLVSAQFDLNSAADKVSFPMPCPVKLVRVGLILLTTDAGGATIKFDKRVTAGSDTSRVSGGVATLTLPASNEQGKYLEKQLKDSSSVLLACGDEIVVNVTSEGAAANSFAVAVVEYFRIQENVLNQSDMVESA